GALPIYCDRLRERGVFNMLFSDSEHLFVYCSTKLSWITRRSPFGKATLHDEDITVDFEQVTTPNDVVTVIATEPLTRNETWHSMQSGELLVFKDGAVVRRLVCGRALVRLLPGKKPDRLWDLLN